MPPKKNARKVCGRFFAGGSGFSAGREEVFRFHINSFRCFQTALSVLITAAGGMRLLSSGLSPQAHAQRTKRQSGGDGLADGQPQRRQPAGLPDGRNGSSKRRYLSAFISLPFGSLFRARADLPRNSRKDNIPARAVPSRKNKKKRLKTDLSQRHIKYPMPIGMGRSGRYRPSERHSAGK